MRHKNTLESIFVRTKSKHEILVYYREIFDTITTLHEPREYRLRNLFARLCEEFESGNIYGVKWAQGTNILDESLTKSNVVIAERLNRLIAERIWEDKIDDE